MLSESFCTTAGNWYVQSCVIRELSLGTPTVGHRIKRRKISPEFFDDLEGSGDDARTTEGADEDWRRRRRRR